MANFPYANPYQNQQFNNYQMPQAAPYFGNQTAQMAPIQQYQPTVQPQNTTVQQNGMMGRIVGNQSEITASEVPMDGLGYFPVSDGSAIFVKTWLGDGSIRTIEYVPKEPLEAVTEPQSGNYEAIMQRFDKLETAYQDIQDAIKDLKEAAKPRTTRKATNE